MDDLRLGERTSAGCGHWHRCPWPPAAGTKVREMGVRRQNERPEGEKRGDPDFAPGAAGGGFIAALRPDQRSRSPSWHQASTVSSKKEATETKGGLCELLKPLALILTRLLLVPIP